MILQGQVLWMERLLMLRLAFGRGHRVHVRLKGQTVGMVVKVMVLVVLAAVRQVASRKRMNSHLGVVEHGLVDVGRGLRHPRRRRHRRRCHLIVGVGHLLGGGGVERVRRDDGGNLLHLAVLAILEGADVAAVGGLHVGLVTR